MLLIFLSMHWKISHNIINLGLEPTYYLSTRRQLWKYFSLYKLLSSHSTSITKVRFLQRTTTLDSLARTSCTPHAYTKQPLSPLLFDHMYWNKRIASAYSGLQIHIINFSIYASSVNVYSQVRLHDCWQFMIYCLGENQVVVFIGY